MLYEGELSFANKFTKMLPEFKSKEEVITFFQVLQHEDISFHPDKPFESYIDPANGQQRYDDEKIALRKAMLDAARQYCAINRLDLYRVYKDTCLQVDMKTKLTEYFPALFTLLENEPLDWKAINEKFSANHLKRLTNYIHGDRQLLEANVYDIISEALNGNSQARRMLSFFQHTLEELSRHLDLAGKKKLKKTLYNLLIETDLNYLNYIGELAVLNVFLWKDIYRLHDIESPLGNGNGADFSLEPINAGKNVLVEVVSIRPRNYPNTPSLLKQFMEGKLIEKIQKKTKGNSAFLKFFLVPVIWGSGEDLAWTAKLLKSEIRLDVLNVTDPLAFATFPDEVNGGSYFRFGSLHSLFP